MHEGITGNAGAIHLHGTELLRRSLPLVKVLSEILVVVREAPAMRTLQSGTIPDPELKVHGRIPQIRHDLPLIEDTAAPAKCSIHRRTLYHGVRRGERYKVSVQRPYDEASRSGHLLLRQCIQSR